jgi:hypothetical protein
MIRNNKNTGKKKSRKTGKKESMHWKDTARNSTSRVNLAFGG